MLRYNGKENVRHSAKNVWRGAENARHGAENVRHHSLIQIIIESGWCRSGKNELHKLRGV